MPDFVSPHEVGFRVADTFAEVLTEADAVVVLHEALLDAIRTVRSDAGLATLERSNDGVSVLHAPTGQSVVVVDIGVETGTTAMSVATYLREHNAQQLALVAAVIPRELEPLLRSVYDQRHALVRPLARRALSWHIAELA
jgi:predicted phosphoribosyltransferase